MTAPGRSRCSCLRCRIQVISGPLMLITLGVLFLVSEYTHYGFGRLWPVLLIAGGLILLIQQVAPDTGHTDS